jgi:iron(III) transport system substrate-binding protein
MKIGKILSSGFLGLLIMLGHGFAQSPTAQDPRLIEAAKKEGDLVWYTSMSISDSQPLLDAFEKKYPFIKSKLVRASSEKTLNRIITETRGGKWDFDVVALSEVGALVQRNLTSPYISPEGEVYSPKFKDPKGHWTAIYNNYYVIGYNTNLVAKKEAPKDWKDFLDPRWKGKISIDQEEYEWFATLNRDWGREKAEKYMKALARQDIQWRKGHTLIAQLMGAGEFPLAIAYAHRIESMKKKGAPVEWVDTVDPVVVSTNGIAVSAKPNHPNAAKLFIDFTLSKEGQNIIRSANRIPARPDVEPLSPKMDQAKLKFEVVPPDMSTRLNEHVENFRRVFNLL